MAEAQPPTIVEGATTGDVDDEIPVAAKSAEARKEAAALSSLDAPRDNDTTSTKDVDADALQKAIDRMSGTAGLNGVASKKDNEAKIAKKAVKVDPADVALLVEELELPKVKATDLLKAHDGDAKKALRAYITPAA